MMNFTSINKNWIHAIERLRELEYQSVSRC